MALGKTIYNALIVKESIASLTMNTAVNGLSLVPANSHLAGAEVELVNIEGREQRLKEASWRKLPIGMTPFCWIARQRLDS